MISKNTEYPDLVFDITVSFAETMSKYGCQNGMAFPVWDTENFVMSKGDGQDYDDFALMEKIYDDTSEMVSNTGGSVIWWDVILGAKGERCNQLISDMASGALTPQEFADMMDALVRE